MPAGKRIDYSDLAGKTFGKLTAVRDLGNGRGWLWKCACGNDYIIKAWSVVYGTCKSCGCYHREVREKLMTQMGNNKEISGHVYGTHIPMIKKAMDGTLPIISGTGHVGVYRRDTAACTVYRAKIGFKGKTINLGQFKTLEEAIEARKIAERKYYKPIMEQYESDYGCQMDQGQDGGQR